MTISFEDLEGAISQIESVRQEEITFEVRGTKITLRGLAPHEDTDVQRYSQEALSDAPEGDQAAFAEFMDRLRYGILGYALMEIGPLNLRDVEYIPSTDEEGNPVDLPKNQAIEQLIRAKWSRAMLASVFKKFTELLDRIEMRADQAVTFDAADLDAEIERVQNRLKELHRAKEQRQEDVEDAISRAQHVVGDVNKKQIDLRRGSQEKAFKPEPEPEQQTAPDPEPEPEPERPKATTRSAPPREPRRPRYPESAAKPPQRPQTPPEDPLAQPPQIHSQPEQEQPEAPQEADSEGHVPSHGIPDPHEGHSFFDPADPEAAIYEEGIRQERIYAQQQKAARERKEQDRRLQEENHRKIVEARTRRQSAPPPGPVHDVSKLGGKTRDPAGLRTALNTQNAVAQSSQPQIRSASSQRPAQLNGKDVFRMDAQTLDRRAKQAYQESDTPPGVIDAPPQGSQNPRFRGAGNGGIGNGNFG